MVSSTARESSLHLIGASRYFTASSERIGIILIALAVWKIVTEWLSGVSAPGIFDSILFLFLLLSVLLCMQSHPVVKTLNPRRASNVLTIVIGVLQRLAPFNEDPEYHGEDPELHRQDDISCASRIALTITGMIRRTSSLSASFSGSDSCA